MQSKISVEWQHIPKMEPQLALRARVHHALDVRYLPGSLPARVVAACGRVHRLFVRSGSTQSSATVSESDRQQK